MIRSSRVWILPLLLLGAGPAQPSGRDQLDAAVAATKARRYDEAIKLLDDADRIFEKKDEPQGRGKAAFYKAIVLQRQGKFNDTLFQYGRSREHFQKAGDATQAARRLLDIGNVYKELLLDYERALAAYDAALRELETQRDLAGMRDVEIDMGNLLIAAGRIDDAISLLQRVRMNTPREEVKPWVRVSQILANAHYRAGSYDVARGNILEAREALVAIEVAVDRASLAIDLTNLEALIEAELGKTDAAVKSFEAALAEAKKFELRPKQSIVLNNLGFWLREAGRHAEATDRLRAALAIDEALLADEGVAYDQRNLALALLADHKAPEAKPLLATALATSTRLGMAHNTAWCRVGLGSVALAESDHAAAITLFQGAYESAIKLPLPDLAWRAAHGLATASLRMKKQDEAFKAFENALAEIEGIEERLGSDAARKGFKTRASILAVFRDYEKALREANATLEAERVRSRSNPRLVLRQRGEDEGSAP